MKSHTIKTLKIYFSATWKYKLVAIFVVISVIVASAIAVVTPILYKSFFDILTSGEAKEVITHGLILTLVYIGVVQLISWLGWRVGTFSISWLQSRVMTDLTIDCFKYLHRHSFSFFNDSFIGSLVKKVKWFGRSYEQITDKLVFHLLTLAVNITLIIIVLLSRSVVLALVIVFWLVIFLIINFVFSYYKLKYDLRRSEAETATTGILADTMTNHGVIKLFNGYKREVASFTQAVEGLRRLRRLTWDLDNVFEAVQGFLMIGLEVGIFYLAVGLWQKGILTVGDFVLIQAYILNIFNRVWDFGRTVRGMYENLADADEMTEILETPHAIIDVPGASDLRVGAGAVEFRNVDFYYHQTRVILKKFNLTIKPREHVALIGPSGAGKTTVVKLLLRMHDVSGGKILIDDQKISRVTQESLWRAISLVPQDPILFHRSLMENIRYGRPEASDEEVIEAAKLAHCHEFISNFADGYNTHVGERGVKLSGGERQRVAIARAILYNAPILVLDEATSSLDSESELLIQNALDTLMKGKTVIVIAHRLSTIRKMDRIIVIDQGGIVEQGTHQALTKKAGSLYQRLWKLQAGGFIK